MKYGLKRDSSPVDDKKSLSENAVVITKVDDEASNPSESAKLTDDVVPTPSETITPTNEVLSSQNEVLATDNESTQAQICPESSNNEPINVEQIVSHQINESETPKPIETLLVPSMSIDVPSFEKKIDQPVIVSESTAMACDDVIIANDVVTLQESFMEVAMTNDDELEMEMASRPGSPVDIQMSDIGSRQSTVNYNLKNAPIVELSRYSWGSNEQKYLRGCIFSPDGTCILTTVNKDGMHVIELPLSLYENETVSVDRPVDILTTAVHVPEGGTVYDYCWYPFMNSSSPETCCFLSTRQHEPIQLWDAFDGKLRCTYRGYDAVDEVDSALSVTFSIDGSQVIAGYKKTVKIFRTDVPGRDYTNFPIKSPVSCLAINRNDANVLAIGSWNSFVTLHDVRSPKLTMTEKLVKHTGGVTLMKFSVDGSRLFTGARKDNKLIAWDLRNSTTPLYVLNRNVETNQKIYFDLSWSGQWLCSGDTNGVLHVYDVEYGTENGKFPDYQYQLHRDCCNGVSLHPTRPIFATASGQHHFIGIEEDIALKPAEVQENSLIFWWCGDTD